ncbi:MAG: hypothetical protein RBU25_11275 [Lentisphaeria bacterium]|jgi:hypothetical protein|nr:hypothetical protein [Lentisphaeria bacterium]
MNRFLWLVVNLGLVVAACALGLWLVGSNPAERWQTVRDQALEPSGQQSGQAPVPDRPEPPAAAAIHHGVGSQNLDSLWRRSLFRPERTEDIVLQMEAEKAQDTPPPPKVEFELVGIAMLNDRRVAILHVRQATPPRPPPSARPGITVRGPGGTIPQPADEPKSPPAKKLFREGDEVGGTGYLLAEIRKREVLLKKGDEELVVSLQMGDDASKNRREEAASAAAAAQPLPMPAPAAADPAAAPASPNVPPPPPPPPPIPGVASPATAPGATAPARNESLEQRLQRIREERERLLRERMKPAENPN